jgi:hypothetical protein
MVMVMGETPGFLCVRLQTVWGWNINSKRGALWQWS